MFQWNQVDRIFSENVSLVRPILNHWKTVQQDLSDFGCCLQQDAIQKEVYAMENESPHMDLLTCTFTTSSSKPAKAADISSEDSNSWKCTGKLNPKIGLGPLEELFSIVSGKDQNEENSNQRFSRYLIDFNENGVHLQTGYGKNDLVENKEQYSNSTEIAYNNYDVPHNRYCDKYNHDMILHHPFNYEEDNEAMVRFDVNEFPTINNIDNAIDNYDHANYLGLEDMYDVTNQSNNTSYSSQSGSQTSSQLIPNDSIHHTMLPSSNYYCSNYNINYTY